MLKAKLNKILRCKLVKMQTCETCENVNVIFKISKLKNTTDFQEEKDYPQNQVSPKWHRVRKHNGIVYVRY